MNPQRHGDLRVSPAPDATRHFAQIVADEFLDAAHDHPIFFTKHPETGAFYAGVVMGLVPGENLSCLRGQMTGYRPADLERQGFFVVEDRIMVEPDHPALTKPDGRILFDEAGEPTTALQRIQHALGRLHTGLAATDAIVARYMQHRLIEPIDVSLSFDDGSSIRLDGLYTISLDRLHALPDQAALDLFRQGDLQLAYAQTGSVRHIRRLARLHNERLAGPSV
ncbi:multidrug transporter [Croceibacterium mercuriale]|uniref:Multidrug transporter n=1 Tax=Croceibacterium mercuriale TaxID=1572751 RepID=A0A0B2C3Z9_9SPHN|nr:multidrug transporter [Croceibacterium mercuriale]